LPFSSRGDANHEYIRTKAIVDNVIRPTSS